MEGLLGGAEGNEAARVRGGKAPKAPRDRIRGSQTGGGPQSEKKMLNFNFSTPPKIIKILQIFAEILLKSFLFFAKIAKFRRKNTKKIKNHAEIALNFAKVANFR